MVKCPECGKEIDTLRHWQRGITVYDCWLEGHGRMDYQHDEFEADQCGGQGYDCPECGVELARWEVKAIEILRGDEKKIECTFCGKKFPESKMWMSGGGCQTCPGCRKKRR
jgi:hypothetical protein